MNDRNEFDKNNEIDLVDFSSNAEMKRIRENEQIERERRMRNAARMRRAEIIRQKKINRIKQMVMAWGILLLCLVVVVAIIVGIVSLFTGNKQDDVDSKGAAVSQEETKLLSAFSSFDGVVYSKDNTEEQYIPSAMNSMYSEMVTASLEPLASPVAGSHLSMITETYTWNASDEVLEKIKQVIRDYPIYSNGYVWSSENSMKSPVVSSYLYDTNAAFVSAVCDICLWEGNTSFLDSVDVTGEANGDISVGMTVGQKLDKVISHFFDYDDYLNGGGVRYNDSDGLVYVLTADNNGTFSGKPSNLFYNYRFGYIDTYNNIVFNGAMNDLSALYTLMGDSEKAEKYKAIAKANKKAINENLYNSSLGRYIGCIDNEGKAHDGGFSVINLMAVSFGIADEEKSKSILSWVEGKRTVKSDSYENPNEFSSLATPSFSTVKAVENWWYNANGSYSLDDEALFGEYWMNGSPSALAGNYYLLSGNTTSEDDVRKRAYHLANEFNEGAYVIPTSEKAEPELYYALSASNAVREIFGISTDGKNLNINPLFNDGENVGINNIAFSGRHYDLLFHRDVVYVMCDENAAVRLRLGGFKKKEKLVLITVQDEIVVSREDVGADKTGTLSLSKKLGGNTYIKIERKNNK
ncbi:MAG: hypothetical protein IJW06_05100 [Clostridia bacterium]|nr:hypothetical protein [Clostridia bacterium]